MGRINVTSALGEPLKAEVELVAEKKEIPSLAVRLASPEAFARAGLTYAGALTDVTVSIEKRGDGEPYVRLSSKQPVDEPFLDLMLELTWSSGRVTRQFTALLDPPSLIAERERQKAEEAKVKAAPAPMPEPEAQPVPAPEQAQPADQVATPTDQATPTQPTDVATAPEQPAQPTAETPAQAAPTPAPAPEPYTPTETIGGTSPTLLGPGSTNPSAAADAYGPVKSGDTLGKIARASKPAEVSLDQMLVLLYRANPDAFAGKNMNRLKTGKILQMPSADEYASLSAADARKEVLAQASDWNAYREQLATAAGQAPAEAAPAQQSASGKVAPTVEDTGAQQGKEAPKEVLKLSKNEPATAGSPAAGGDAKSQARMHALEEELIARDKAVKDANDRVAKLEKTVKDLQALLEIKNKGMSDLQKPAVPATPPASPAAPPKPAIPATPAPATPPVEAKATPVTPAAPEAPKPAPEAAPPATQPTPPQPKPAPPKPVAPPPPAPEPSLMDRVLEQPAYLGAGVLALVLIGALAVRAVKRRRESKADSDDSGPAIVAAAPAAAGGYSIGDAVAAAPELDGEVDPVKEAEIFLAYGRDAQAEELLKEALAANPNRQEVRAMLLQIYAKRKDTKSFEGVARELQQATNGSGPLWDQAVALGYQVDPANPRYAAGAAGGVALAATASAAAAAENVDFNIGTEDDQSTTTDIDLGEGGAGLDRTEVIDLSQEPSHDDTAVLEQTPVAEQTISFNMNLPAADPSPEPSPAAPSSGLDFDIDLNSFNTQGATAASAEPEARPDSGGNTLDFDMSGLSLDAPAPEPRMDAPAAAPEIDLSGISLDLGGAGETTPRVSPSGKDDHWYDVQTKFDLAKAYQEMGDKDGAREILKEVLQEGDAEQKSAAQSVLASLDA